MNSVARCEVKSKGKMAAKQKRKKERKKKGTMVNNKNKRTVMNLIWRQMKKRSRSSVRMTN